MELEKRNMEARANGPRPRCGGQGPERELGGIVSWGLCVLSLGVLGTANTPLTLSAQAPPDSVGTLPAPAAAPERPRPVRSSWTSDRVALREGDLITIFIDEYTVATADRNDSASRQKDRDLSVSGGQNGSTMGGGLRTGNDVARRDRGESSRRERFAAEMSARVVEATPSGSLKIEGHKKVQIDDHEQEIVVRGWVRAQDVSSSNTVESWRIAEAEILYTSNGELVKAGGIWSKLLNLLVP